MPVLPATLQIQHLVWTTTGSTDARGNPAGALAPPVTRQVIGFYNMSAPGQDPISLDYLERTITDKIMLVPSGEAELYHKLDRVEVSAGVAVLTYEVQNVPIDWGIGFTWRRYAALLAGEVHIKRVQ